MSNCPQRASPVTDLQLAFILLIEEAIREALLASRTGIVWMFWIIFLMGLLHPLPRQTEHKKRLEVEEEKEAYSSSGSGRVLGNDLGQWSVISWSQWQWLCVFKTFNTFLSIEVICRDRADVVKLHDRNQGWHYRNSMWHSGGFFYHSWWLQEPPSQVKRHLYKCQDPQNQDT